MIPTTRCSACPNTHRCVPGDGPHTTDIVCIGEAPGRDEDNGGRPFIGAAGREFNQLYLSLAGLHRDEVYVTNAKKCRPPQNKTPEYKEMIGCANHFVPHELAAINPTYVVLMGSTACKLLGEHEVDLEAEHGIPRWGKLYEWEGWIVPINHPASGLHDGAMMQPMIEDWEALGVWWRTGEWQWAEDEQEKDYRLVRTENEVVDYFQRHKRYWQHKKIFNEEFGVYLHPLNWAGVDSETHAGRRWSMQFSIKPHTSIMVQTDTAEFDAALLQVLRYYLENHEFVYHHAEADVWVADVLGLGENHPHRDTLQEAYAFQNLPQKLKALSRRLLGRKRQSWEELVTPYSKERLHDWLCDAIIHAEANWTTTTQRIGKRGQALKPVVKASEAEKVLRAVDGFMVNNPDYPVWKKLVERVDGGVLAELCGLFGPWPRLGIAHVPIDDAVWYGCSDADDTLRLALEMEKMRGEFVEWLAVREEDRDQ